MVGNYDMSEKSRIHFKRFIIQPLLVIRYVRVIFFTYVTAISSGDLKMIYFADFLKITENRLISCKKVKSSMIELIHTNSEYLVISVN